MRNRRATPHSLTSATPTKEGLHPRNRHATRYDFPALIRTSPALAAHVRPGLAGTDTIDFADPAAVIALNRALLQHHYGVSGWDIPPGYLCPPVPGRADYVHRLADLIAGDAKEIPRGPAVAVLDIGVGANGIYPIVGVAEYDWSFVGTDIDPTAVAWLRQLVSKNAHLARRIEVRLQPSPQQIFAGVVRRGERFAACLCNPPFHASAVAASAAAQRKLRNLSGGKAPKRELNFGGRSNELWCPGGEAAFVRRMIAESAQRPQLCRWFTTLVSNRESLPPIYRALDAVKPVAVRTLELAHGQKQTRIVAWQFSEPASNSARTSIVS